MTNFRVIFDLVDFKIIKSRAPAFLTRFFSLDFGSILRVIQSDKAHDSKSTFTEGDTMVNMMAGSSQELERKPTKMFGLFEQSHYSKTVVLHTRDSRIFTVGFGADDMAADAFANLVKERGFKRS